jgi:hypothetical protein
VDFLGVLVPGAVLVYLEDDGLHRIFGTSPLQAPWLVFATTAYLFGQLLLASTEVFNRLGERILSKLRCLSKTQQDACHVEEKSLRLLRQAAGNNHPGTTFHAALSFLRLEHAEAAAEVDRHTADYKLLRNMVAVFLIDLVLTIPRWRESHARLTMDFVLVPLFFLAFLRMFQWAKLLAFQYCILIYNQKSDDQKQRSSSSSIPPRE